MAGRRARGRSVGTHRRGLPAQVAGPRRRRRRRLAQARPTTGSLEHLGRRRLMMPADVVFPLAPVYARARHRVQAGPGPGPPSRGRRRQPGALRRHRVHARRPRRRREEIRYDYLINATGPKLNFGATPGLGPDGPQPSVCTDGHAAETAAPSTRRSSGCGAASGSASSSALATAPAPARAPPSSTSSTSSSSCGRAACATRPTSCGSRTNTSSATSAWAACTSSAAATSRRARSSPSRCSPSAESRWITRAPRAPGRAGPGALRDARRRRGRGRVRLRDAAAAFSRRRLKAFDRAGADITAQVFQPERLHEGGRRLRARSPTSSGGARLAADLPVAGLPELFAAGIAFAPPHAISRPDRPRAARRSRRRRRAPACRRR